MKIVRITILLLTVLLVSCTTLNFRILDQNELAELDKGMPQDKNSIEY